MKCKQINQIDRYMIGRQVTNEQLEGRKRIPADEDNISHQQEEDKLVNKQDSMVRGRNGVRSFDISKTSNVQKHRRQIKTREFKENVGKLHYCCRDIISKHDTN